MVQPLQAELTECKEKIAALEHRLAAQENSTELKTGDIVSATLLKQICTGAESPVMIFACQIVGMDMESAIVLTNQNLHLIICGEAGEPWPLLSLQHIVRSKVGVEIVIHFSDKTAFHLKA